MTYGYIRVSTDKQELENQKPKIVSLTFWILKIDSYI